MMAIAASDMQPDCPGPDMASPQLDPTLLFVGARSPPGKTGNTMICQGICRYSALTLPSAQGKASHPAATSGRHFHFAGCVFPDSRNDCSFPSKCENRKERGSKMGGMAGFRESGATLLLLLAACTPRPEDQARRSVESGEAVREIQAHFDRDPGQCAAVLTGVSPIEIDTGHLRLRTVRALIHVGLLEVVPGASEGAVRLRPTAKARPHFRERRGPAGAVGAELCYARRKITRAWLIDGDGQTLNFAYRLVDSPDWARDPRLQAAFPFLASALSRELVATGIVPFRDGRWFLGLADSAASIPDHHEGFWACPGDGEKPDSACR